MKLTVHANERILGRTKMLTQDVLSIVSSGAVVELGASRGREYLLFYSHPDLCVKVAIVSEGRKTLISVLEKDHFLPLGVSKVTKRHENEARRALKRFLFERIKAQESKQKERRFPVKIYVEDNGKTIYTYNAGDILLQSPRSREDVLAQVAPVLNRIMVIVEENKTVENGVIGYVVCVFDAVTLKTKSYRLNHETLLEQLRAN